MVSSTDRAVMQDLILQYAWCKGCPLHWNTCGYRLTCFWAVYHYHCFCHRSSSVISVDNSLSRSKLMVHNHRTHQSTTKLKQDACGLTSVKGNIIWYDSSGYEFEEKWHTARLNTYLTRNARISKPGLAKGVRDGKIRGRGKPPPSFPFDESS